jgi:hypothetical protein
VSRMVASGLPLLVGLLAGISLAWVLLVEIIR